MKAILAAGLTLLLAGTAFAQTEPKEDPIASVDDVVGEVLINQGEDYVAPADGLRLREGDQVLTKDNSSVVVRYDDDCDVKVEENTIYTVDEPDDCAAILAVGSGSGLGAGSTGRFILAGVGLIGVIAIFTESGSDRPDRVVSP